MVHAQHGVGRFLGLREIAHGETTGDYMLLEYAADARLYVPLTRMDLVQKFRGAGGEGGPALDRLGGVTWERTKKRVKAKMRDMAEELLKLYAERKLAEGFAVSPDSNWQREFEDAFEFAETPDQLTAIAEVKRDMESTLPMDRLLCGDVGFGKTEVAMRAAFKALGDGRQVAVLAPTTVLCFQHYETFKRRFAPFPVRVEMLSRFVSPNDRKTVLADLAEGKVDIVIGTHRHPVQGCRVPRPGPDDRGRRAALRRASQGTPEADPEERRRAHHDRHADPAHAAHVAAGTARYVGDRNAAQGSVGHPHRSGPLRAGCDPHRHRAGDQPRRAGVLRAQPGGVHLGARPPKSSSSCPTAGLRWATAR